MTVSSALDRKTFTGDDLTVAFATTPVVFFDETDLQVYVITVATGVATLQSLTTDYTVTGGAGSTGTVTMLTAPASTEQLLIKRVVPITQAVDLVNNDASDAETMEDSLDKLTMIAQQLSTGSVDGGYPLRISDAETPTDALTVLPFDRASKLLGFNSAKELVVYDPTDGANDSASVTFLQSGAGASAETVQTVLRYLTRSVKSFGAVGDGVTDDAAAITAAIAACTAGDELFFPRGTYNVGSTVTLNKKLKLRGAVAGESGGVTVPVGSIITGTGTTLVQMTEPCVLEDIAILESAAGGSASTIALDVNDGATGVQNWELRNVFICGTASKLGTGLRTVFGLKGKICGGVIEGWSIGVDQQNSGAAYSNANCYTAVKVRVNATGFKSNSANVYLFGCTLEGNTTNGVENTAGTISLIGNHLENAASGANVKISGGNLVSVGNGFYDTPTSLDIWISAGAGLHSSMGDTLNNGIKHEGTGVFTVTNPVVSLITTGSTGPIAQLNGSGFVGTNLSGQVLGISGYAWINTALAYLNNSGTAKIGGSSGASIVDDGSVAKFTVNAAGAISALVTTNGPVGTATLTANAASTTVNNTAVTASSLIYLFPTSANAAADVGSATGVYISAKVASTSFTITHPNNANADKTFNYLVLN